MSTRRACLLAAIVTVAACNDTATTTVASLDLDRPVDVSFACHGSLRLTKGEDRPGTLMDPTLTETPVPVADCDGFTRRTTDGNATVIPPKGQEDLTSAVLPDGVPEPGNRKPTVEYYAFVLQSVAGTVAVSHWSTLPAANMVGGSITLKDVDPLTPGPSGIAIGDLPVGIRSDASGCYQVTANAGSCDLSVLEVNSVAGLSPHPKVTRIAVTDPNGMPVLARPAAIVAQPQDGVIGVTCPTTPTGLVYVAYPDCHLVAAIDAATGKMEGGLHFDAAGVATVATVADMTSCPAQCGAGGALTAGTRPSSLDLVYDNAAGVDTRRLAIGAENSSKVTVVDLGADYLPATITQVALEDPAHTLGINRLALSRQIGMGGATGAVDDANGPGGQFQFVYAVANDGTVRVADVLTERVECDTEIDPHFLVNETDVHYLSCMPVGDARNKPRRNGARGPGIELVGAARPVAVAFVQGLHAPATADPSVLVGTFAVVTAANGSVYVVNVDDDNEADTDDPAHPLTHTLADVLPHQVRDGIGLRYALPEVSGGVDANNQPLPPKPICDTQGAPPGDSTTAWAQGPRLFQNGGVSGIPQAISLNRISSAKAPQLPTVRQVDCAGKDITTDLDAQGYGHTYVNQLAFAAPAAIRKAAYPDVRAMRLDETWTLTWEGSLSNDSSNQAIDGPPVRAGQAIVDGTGLRVVDTSRSFCDAGVEPYDQVVLRGCDPGAVGQCGLDETCYVHPDAAAGHGSCLPTDIIAGLAGPCRDFLVAPRNYAVTSAKSGELRLIGRRHVLRTTPLSGCTSSDQCTQLATLDARLTNSDNDVTQGRTTYPFRPSDHADSAPAYACEADPSRPGHDQCVMECGDDPVAGPFCDVGSVCENHRCVEGVVPPLECLPEIQRYEIDASNAFAVLGSITGYQHPIIADPATGACVRDPKANPLQIGRIPLQAAPCLSDDIADLSPNPCSTVVKQTEAQPNYVAGSDCVLDTIKTKLITRDAPAIRFRNAQMTFELVDPTYPGDAKCNLDRGGTQTDIPYVFPGYALQARIIAGFLPYLIQLVGETSYPVNVLRGPLESIWVVDEGDYVSHVATVPSASGRVFRIESIDPVNRLNIVQ